MASKSPDPRLTRRTLLAASGGVAIAGATLGPGAALAEEAKKLPKVPRRVLGKTGQSIPILLFGGAMRLDQRFDPKLAKALQLGVDYFDAADCYGGGTCETAVGAFQARAKTRDKIWITTKSDLHDPEGFEQTLNTSLRKLQTDYVDMYFLHALKKKEELTKALEETVARLKKEKKIRFFGFSCHDGNVPELLHAAAETPWVDAVMFRYNFRQYGNKALNEAIDAAHAAKVGLIAMKTQGSETSFEDAWKKFEKTGKWSKHQAVLKAVWADPRITAAVSHMDTFEKLEQNVAAAIDAAKLTQAEQDALQKYAEATRPYACDGCDHLCGPAVDAPVQIGATLRYLMYHDVYGDPAGARELFAQLPAEARALADVDFSRANAACPNRLDVAAHMRRAARVLASEEPQA